MSMKNPANRRYTIRLAILMLFYLVFLFAAVRLFRTHTISGLPAYALAIAPALPVIGVFWAVMRLIAEQNDEYQRLLLVRQTLVASGFAMSIATAWGFLENFDLVGHIDAFYWAVLWFLGLGIGSIYNKLTLGDAGCA